MSDTDTTHAEEVLLYIITQIVEDKSAIEIDVEETDAKVSMVAKVAQGDMGRVIGKRGRVAHAIRTIVRAAGSRDGVEVEVDFDG